jgi:uncharacterized protein YegJ (DUF2314 family)
VTGGTSAEDVVDIYRHLAKLFSEFLDENTLLIFIPELNRGFPFNGEVGRALQSDDPLAAIQEIVTVPIVQVSGDDSLLQEAVAKAKSEWPRFIDAFETKAGKDFACKAPISHSGNTEFIWIEVSALEGSHVFGTLANNPANLGPMKLGSNVRFPVSDLNDWCYFDPEGNLQGGFTMAAIAEATRRKRKA